MLKRDEMAEPNSCWNRAHDDEMLFVLLGRDLAMPATIRAWVVERLRIGKNKVADPQISEAIKCAYRLDGVKVHESVSHNLAMKAVGCYCVNDPPKWTPNGTEPEPCGRSCQEWIVFRDRVTTQGSLRLPFPNVMVRDYLCPCGRVWSFGVTIASNGHYLPPPMPPG